MALRKPDASTSAPIMATNAAAVESCYEKIAIGGTQTHPAAQTKVNSVKGSGAPCRKGLEGFLRSSHVPSTPASTPMATYTAARMRSEAELRSWDAGRRQSKNPPIMAFMRLAQTMKPKNRRNVDGSSVVRSAMVSDFGVYPIGPDSTRTDEEVREVRRDYSPRGRIEGRRSHGKRRTSAGILM